MYTEEYEKRGFPFRNFILKLAIVAAFVLLLAWLLPKFISPRMNSYTGSSKACAGGSATCDLSGLDALTSQIFADNLDRMKNAAISYYTDERLPKEVGESDTMTLSDMIGKKIIIALIDKNNKACDLEKSYVKITKLDDEYILKVNLKDSEKEDYILVHLGCYTYCDGYLCQKEGTTNTPVKGSKVTGYVPIKGSIVNGTYYPPKKPTPVVPVTPSYPKCEYKDGKYYDATGRVVSESEFKKSCNLPEEKHYCVYFDGKYYDNKGKIVTKNEYKKACQPSDDEKHYCVKYKGKYYDNKGNIVSYKKYKELCEPEVKHICVKYNGDYYDSEGNIVSYSKYKESCGQEDKHYCVYYNGSYYDDNGDKVNYSEYKTACMPYEPEEKHYCVYYNGSYYDDEGNKVTYSKYKEACFPSEPEVHKCEKYDGKYYDKNGNIVTKVNYIISCQAPKCKIIDGYYFGKTGKHVTKATYEKECKPAEYVYEYKKTTEDVFSKWTSWSAWNKTNCATDEINCNDANKTCLKKLQVLKRKEQIGTYQKTYAKTRNVIRQTGSYTQKACSKYNYVEINKTIYATTTTTTYTQTNTITSTTRHSTGGWTYNGRASYSNPPRDSASTHYKFAGADYSYCSDTCTTLPNYYYDSYTYTGGLTSVSTTTTPGAITSSTSTTTSSDTTTSTEASCGEYVTKTIPIYGTITVSEKAYRTEPLYGDVCYASTKTRKLISEGSTQTKWSKYNDTSLLNSGWTYTGRKKQK